MPKERLSSDYSRFSKAELSFSYLHTNSTTHEFLFGALAEIVDNARDAGAKYLNIDVEKNDHLRGGNIIWFIDDGQGIGPTEVSDVIKFGRSSKRLHNLDSIGMYGNGLKSGSMRIANDVILLTKKDDTYSVILLSRTFLENEGLNEIVVAMPQFQVDSFRPYIPPSKSIDVHNHEVGVVLRYSPWKTLKDIEKQFHKIKGISGTAVAIYNLKLLNNGDTELDFKAVNNDILISSGNSWTESQTDNIDKEELLRFRVKALKDLESAQNDLKCIENLLREINSKISDLNKKTDKSLKELNVEINKEKLRASQVADEAKEKRIICQNLEKAVRQTKVISFIYGMKIENRYQDGIFIYNCGRLIKMYQKYRPQSELSLHYGGIVGIVDIPYQILEPTHNKQDFADAKEFKMLQKALSDGLIQYYKDMNFDTNDIEDFWISFGYKRNKQSWTIAPDPNLAKKRCLSVPKRIQCHDCFKWRIIPYGKFDDVRDDWRCRNHSNKQLANCNKKDDPPAIVNGGNLKKQRIPTFDEIEEDYRRHQRKLAEENSHTDMILSDKREQCFERISRIRHHSSENDKEDLVNSNKLNKLIPKRRGDRQQYHDMDSFSATKKRKTKSSSIEDAEVDVVSGEVDDDTSENTKLASNFKKCLEYFRPPKWNQSAEDIKRLTVQDLIRFPHKEFIQTYDKSLKKKFEDMRLERDTTNNIFLSLINSVKDFLRVLCNDDEHFARLTNGIENYSNEQLGRHYMSLLEQYQQQIQVKHE
ncbi:DgyrCDS3619 [Dimorphilus gyrociliatus]|uniref:DgyrCDS3619 n=1 Tax=Dimorphilus gyrociliatus TaxID=2664684 RepID=A0A7I8VEC1_9ANNE|nr:DgyrCDS3619 [Dimorphilus gyrociliatus]